MAISDPCGVWLLYKWMEQYPTPFSLFSAATFIEVYSIEKQVLTFTGGSEAEEHFAFHSLYTETPRGLSIYVTKEHQNQAAGVLWCYLK